MQGREGLGIRNPQPVTKTNLARHHTAQPFKQSFGKNRREFGFSYLSLPSTQ